MAISGYKVLRRAVLAGVVMGTLVVLVAGSAVLAQGIAGSLLDQMVDVWADDRGREVVRDYPDGVPDSPWLRVVDPVGDNDTFSTGETTNLTDIPPNIDIVGLTGERWDPPPDFFAPVENGGVFCEDPTDPVSPTFRTFCGEAGADPAVFSEGASVFGFELGGPVGGMRQAGRTCEWVLWFNVVPAGEPWVNRDAFPNDPAGGTNRAIGLRIGDEGAEPFRLDIVDGFFTPMPTGSVVAAGGDFLDIHIPNSEIEGASGVNGYTFCTDGGFTAADSTSDQTGLIDIEADPTGVFSFVDVPEDPVEVEEPTPALNPEPQDVVEQPAVVEEPAAIEQPVEPPASDSSVDPEVPAPSIQSEQLESSEAFLSPALVIGLGVLLMFLAAFVAFFPGIAVGSTSDRCVRERREVARWKAELNKALAAENQRQAEDDDLKKRLRDAPFDRSLKPMERAKLEERLAAESTSAFHALQNARSYVKGVREALAKAHADLAACENRSTSGGTTDPGTTGEPSPGGTAAPTAGSSATPVRPNCCPKGNWIGVNVYTGGMGFFYGRETGFVTLWCMEDPGRWAVLQWSGTRWGIGLGGEASAGLFIVLGGGIHPAELTAPVAKILGGFDFDLSVGVSLSKLAKGAAKAGFSWDRWKKLKASVEAARGASKALDKARKANDVRAATKIATQSAEVFEELIKDGVADDLVEITVKGASSGGQAGGTGVNIPYGKGLQVGAWKLTDVQVVLWDLSGCKTCDPSK